MSTIGRITTVAVGAALTIGAAAPAAQAQPNTDSLAPPAQCDIDLDAIAAEHPVPEDWQSWHQGWIAGPSSNLGGDLGYLILDTKGGTGSSPSEVVLFHRCEPTRTQPTGQTRAIAGSSTNFSAAIGWQRSEEGNATADAPFDYTLWVWNPLAGDAQAIPLPQGMKL